MRAHAGCKGQTYQLGQAYHMQGQSRDPDQIAVRALASHTHACARRSADADGVPRMPSASNMIHDAYGPWLCALPTWKLHGMRGRALPPRPASHPLSMRCRGTIVGCIIPCTRYARSCFVAVCCPSAACQRPGCETCELAFSTWWTARPGWVGRSTACDAGMLAATSAGMCCPALPAARCKC